MKKRIIIGILIAALVAGGSAGGATYYKKSHQMVFGNTSYIENGLTNQNYSYATAIGLFSGIIGLILVSSSNALSRKLTGDGIY